MKKKISLQRLMDEDLLEMPEPDMVLALADYRKIRPNLLGSGGIYLFKMDTQYLYIGITNNLGTRVHHHISGNSRGNKDLKKLIEIEDNITLEIMIIESKVYQEIYESYLIQKYKPMCNKRKIDGGYNIALGTVGRPTIPVETRDIVLDMINSNSRVSEIAKTVGISIKSVYNIRKRQ